MKETMITPDGMKLTARYQGLIQTPSLKRDDNRWMIVFNPNSKATGIVGKREFDTAEEAKAAIMEEIRQRNRGARVETTMCGSIGVDFVIDEKSAKEFEVTAWTIRKQWRTNWENIEEFGTTD